MRAIVALLISFLTAVVQTTAYAEQCSSAYRNQSGLPTAQGYAKEIQNLSPSAPHTVKDVRGYLKDNLGLDTLTAAQDHKTQFIIAVGEGPVILEKMESQGWKILNQVNKTQGYHQVYHAQSPTGQKTFIVARVNGNDRIIHIQSLLKLAGVSASRVQTLGETRSWEKEFLESFKNIGQAPDLVVYGFANTAVDTVLLQNKMRNDKHFDDFLEAYQARHLPVSRHSHDFDGNVLQVIRLKNGKTIWFINCMYGDISKDLGVALAKHGAQKILFLGTAGALDSSFAVGDLTIPTTVRHENGQRSSMSNFNKIKSVQKRGVYQRVSTPNIETQEWLQQSLKNGVELVEVELDYWSDVIKDYPKMSVTPVIIVSDVLSGPNAQDMTIWGINETQALRPKFRDIFFEMFEAKSESEFSIDSYFAVPLVTGARIKP